MAATDVEVAAFNAHSSSRANWDGKRESGCLVEAGRSRVASLLGITMQIRAAPRAANAPPDMYPGSPLGHRDKAC